MKQFLKFTFASMLGFILANILIIFISMMIIISMISMGQPDEVVVEENSLLHIKINRPVQDRAPLSPDFRNFPNDLDIYPGLNDILENLKKAKVDSRIKGIYLELEGIPGGTGIIEELRTALLDFKESGKFVVAYSNMVTQASYYLATAADKIYVNPGGIFFFKGLNAELVFLKGTLEKLDIEAQVIRPEGNKFKSAVEPLIYDKMSEANREQMSKLVFSIWDHMIYDIADSRDLTSDKLNEIADNLEINQPQDAVDLGMIDGAIFKDELNAELRTRLGLKENKKIEMVDMADYTSVNVKEYNKKFTRNKIAVVYALGDIVMGEGDDFTIGSERISKAIRKARLDTNVRAIVLRVNSPGGDAQASDIILRELILAKEKKPVIASYGDVAASGGYWISCKADKILAEENTITGSIGVFGIWPNFQGFFNNKLGMTFDNVATNDNAGFPSVNRKMADAEKEYMQDFVENIYQTFLTYVSESRNMTVEEVDKIAQGRVWSGTDAKEIGLIDDFGGLTDAVKLAAEMANLDEYKIVSLPTQKKLIDQIMEELTGKKSDAYLKKALGEHYELYRNIQTISKYQGVHARMLHNIEIN